jgi:hypothetical protein
MPMTTHSTASASISDEVSLSGETAPRHPDDTDPEHEVERIHRCDRGLERPPWRLDLPADAQLMLVGNDEAEERFLRRYVAGGSDGWWSRARHRLGRR